MIGIVIVSTFSSLIADGTKELALQIANPTLKIMTQEAHQMERQRYKIKSTYEKVNGADGVSYTY